MSAPLPTRSVCRRRRVLDWLRVALPLLAATAALAAVPDDRQTLVDQRVQALQTQGRFPGIALAVVRDGDPVLVGLYGSANLEHDVPVTEKTVFELASVTKQMTALAIAQLVADGKLTYESKLADVLTDLPTDLPEAWREVTVNQLLSHTAGFEHHFEPTMNGSHLLENSTADMLAAARALPLRSRPGEDWHYSDLGYFLLGRVIESAAGMRFEQFMQATFFGPLGMSQTHLLDQNRIVPHRAQGYRWANDRLLRNRRVWNFELTPHFGVMSSLTDMIRWEQALVGQRGAHADAAAQTVRIQRPFSTGKSCDTWGYARGWFAQVVDGVRYVHHGGYAGTAYLRNVDRRLSVIVLTNREDGPDQINPVAIAWSVMNVFDPATPKDGFRCWQ